MKSKATSDRKALQIQAYFDTLYRVWGPQHWWPADSPFEVILGAILTQNTAWTNVEKALANLRAVNAISPEAVHKISITELEQMLRPAGYFRQKSVRLKKFVGWLDKRFAGSLESMFATGTFELRAELLALNGIGPETADSILLYAGQHEIFVVDAYTRRIFERHALIGRGEKYDAVRTIVESALSAPQAPITLDGRFASSGSVEPGPGPVKEVLTPVVHVPSPMSRAPRSPLARRYNEFHALLVQVAKHYCQSRVARCEGCPLRIYLKNGRPRMETAKPRSSRKKPPK